MSSPLTDRQTYPNRAVATRIGTDRGDFAALDASPDGEPRATLLLVAGYTGSKEDFTPLFDPLADAGYRVVAIDQRGQFETAGGSESEHYTTDSLGQDVVSVARAIGSPVHVLGHSFGGLVVRAAVVASPADFASVVLMSSGPGQLGDGPRKAMILGAEPHLFTLGLDGIYDLSQQALRKDPMFVAPPGDLADFLRTRFVSNSPYALQFMGHAMLEEPDRVEALRATGVPAMVLYGNADNAWTPESQSDMAVRLGAREVLIDNAMHSPQFENTAETLGALLDFWNTQA